MPTSRSQIHIQGLQIGALLLGMALGAAVAFAQLPRPDQPVSLYFTVEKGDKLVEGLGPQNFHLYQNGDPRPFQLEKPETPISIALLVEDSEASYYYWNDIQAALQGFLDNAPAGNWYALAHFSHDLKVDVDFTKQIGRIRDAIGSLEQPTWNDIDTYDAIWGMLDKMGQLPGRKVLIVVGSGLDSFSGHTLDDVQKKIEEANVTVYCPGTGSALRGYYEPYLGSIQRMDLLQAQSFLQMLAEKSGGQAWFPMEEGAYPDVMKGIFQSLQAQYRIVYTPNVPRGKFSPIKLEAFRVVNDKREDYKARVREGWLFP